MVAAQVEEEEQILYLAICYIPPDSSICTAGGEETLWALAEGVEKYNSMGPLVTCGDFNARCGSAHDGISGVPNRKVIDVVRNSQGGRFMNFLRSTEKCVVGGRKGKDAFMCVSGRGCSVVDYRVVGRKILI